MKEEYRMTVEVGDIVLMPNDVVGIVASWDILVGGNCKEVVIYPFTKWLYHCYLFLSGKLYFHDENINLLKKIK